MMSATMHDFPGYNVRLRMNVEDDAAEDHTHLARLAIGAVFSFSEGLCIPLAMEFSVAYWDSDFDIPIDSPERSKGNGMLRRRTLPPELDAKPYYLNSQMSLAEEIDSAAAISFIENFLSRDESDIDGLTVGWQEMQFNATMARLPDDDSQRDHNAVRLEVAGHSIDYPIENRDGSDWVNGPVGASVIHAPFEYRIHRDSGEMIFDITIYWSTWSPGGPGWPAVERGIARLTGGEWEREWVN